MLVNSLQETDVCIRVKRHLYEVKGGGKGLITDHNHLTLYIHHGYLELRKS